MSKKPFDIDRALKAIEQAVKPWPKAAMFELAESGYSTPFEQLAACMISIRTYDEVTVPTALRLFERARTPAQMSKLTTGEIDSLIRTCTFHERKAEQILGMALRVVAEYDGKLPCDAEVMQSFPGVGPKCAHLVLGVACHEPYISVDIHVHSPLCSESNSSTTVRRAARTRRVFVHTFMPLVTGIEQEAARFRAPSTSTTHTRHAPIASSPSTWQSVGIRTPACRAAWRIVVPSGTCTATLLTNASIMCQPVVP